MEKYDQQLVTEAQIYFSKLCGQEISPEEAESFLKSLAELFDSLFDP